MRRLLERGDLPQPDEILPHQDGGIVCLWHEQKLAVIVDPDPPEAGSRAPSRSREADAPTIERPGAIAQLGERRVCNARGRRFDPGWLHLQLLLPSWLRVEVVAPRTGCPCAGSSAVGRGGG